MRPYEPMKRWVVNTLTIRYYSLAQPKESKDHDWAAAPKLTTFPESTGHISMFYL